MLSSVAPSAGSEVSLRDLCMSLPSTDQIMATYIIYLIYLSDPFYTLLILSSELKENELENYAEAKS